MTNENLLERSLFTIFSPDTLVNLINEANAVAQDDTLNLEDETEAKVKHEAQAVVKILMAALKKHDAEYEI